MDKITAWKWVYDFEDAPGYEEVSAETIVDQDRWFTYFEQVVKHTPAGEYWRLSYARGSTEYQEMEKDDEMRSLLVTKVRPVERTVIEYEEIVE